MATSIAGSPPKEGRAALGREGEVVSNSKRANREVREKTQEVLW